MYVSKCIYFSKYIYVTITVINNCVFQPALQQLILPKPTNSWDKKNYKFCLFKQLDITLCSIFTLVITNQLPYIVFWLIMTRLQVYVFFVGSLFSETRRCSIFWNSVICEVCSIIVSLLYTGRLISWINPQPPRWPPRSVTEASLWAGLTLGTLGVSAYLYIKLFCDWIWDDLIFVSSLQF